LHTGDQPFKPALRERGRVLDRSEAIRIAVATVIASLSV
jgi:hypothetical protein